MLSKTFAYALRAVTYVAVHSKEGKKVNLEQLSEGIDVPQPFLGKIMQDLVRQGVLKSMKGPGGGFWTDEFSLKLPAFEILNATDGYAVLTSCLMGKKNCNSSLPCPLHAEYALCRDTLFDALRNTRISDLAQKVEAKEIFLAEDN
ncbi:MAG: Rrf2 family transcriptional regulator [Bacteroidia bacterium]|nr:Rrf2 family transcriptional regulator [Bacteroidia bacterium]